MRDTVATHRQRATEVHVYLCKTAWASDAALLARYREMLDPAERLRLPLFRFQRDRDTFLMSHALVRTVLSLYADVPADAWRFAANEYGRPEIAGPGDAPPLRFNLSHTRGLVACVVTRTLDAGIDVEARTTADDILQLASRFFAPSEAAALRRAPERTRTARFLSTWTLKESYIKARGMGVALPLDGFAFELRGKRIEVRFDPALADSAEDWSFALMRPTQEHWLAVAVHAKPGATPGISAHWHVPLTGMHATDAAPTIVAATANRGPAGSRAPTSAENGRESPGATRSDAPI